jgi:hypothetical protein
MTGFPVLDVGIGLAFVYLLLALVCTTVMEWIAQLHSLRGRTLYDGTRALLGERGAAAPVTEAVFNHPLIDGLADGKRGPSYIPSTLFAKVLQDVLTRPTAAASGVVPAASPHLQESLRVLEAGTRPVPEAQGGGVAVATVPSEAAIAQWYDQGMDRVSGTYKRMTRRIVIWLALAVTIAMNANTLSLSTMLWQNPTLRAYMVERAKTRLDQGPPLETVEYADPTTPTVTAPVSRDSSKSPDRLLAEEQSMLGQIFSWGAEARRIRQYQADYGATLGIVAWSALSLLGWIITALAVSLGAPFWFDTLNQFMRVRAAGEVPSKTTEKGK